MKKITTVNLNLVFFLQILLFSFSQYQQCFHKTGSKIGGKAPTFGNIDEYSKDNTIGGLNEMTSFVLQNEKSDLGNEIILFFGKTDLSDSGPRDHVWKYSTVLNQWKFVKGRKEKSQGPVNLDPKQIGQFSKSLEIGQRYGNKGWMNRDGEHTIISFFGGSAFVPKFSAMSSSSYTLDSDEPQKLALRTNDFWKYNVSSNQYAAMKFNYIDENDSLEGLYASNYFPGARQFHEIVKINEKFVLLVGGYGHITISHENKINLADYWIFNREGNYWGIINGLSITSTQAQNMNYGEKNVYDFNNRIGVIKYHSGALINHEEVMIYGGMNEFSVFSSIVHKFNVTSMSWKYVSGDPSFTILEALGYTRSFNESNLPGSRTNAKIWKIKNDEVLLFGGFGFQDSRITPKGYLNDEWRFNTNSNLWKYSGLESSKYLNRYIYSGFNDFFGGMHTFSGNFDEETNSLYIIGGYGYDLFQENYLEDVWRVYLGEICYSIEAIDPDVCSGNGICQSFDTCVCNDGYFGEYCQIHSCNEILSNNSLVCNGNGICKDGNCECSINAFYVDQNDFCRIDKTLEALVNSLWVFIVVPIVFISLLCIFVVIIVIFIILITKLKTDLKKFDEIEDIDVILEEQKFAKDSSVAHLKINKSLFEIDVKDIKILEKIGQGGGSACVYSAMWNNQKVAYKCFQVNDYLETSKFSEFEKEVEILASVKFPYILTFYGATMNAKRLGFVIEYAENGDLEQFLKSKKGKNYPINEKIRMLYEISSAMLYLHNNKIIHRDLKLQNILVTKKEESKLMDFGLSKIILEKNERTRTKKVGTSFFIAPEISSGHYSYPCDVYSFAMVIFIVITENFTPFGTTNANYISSKIHNNPSFRPNIKEVDKFNIPKELKEMIKQNWNQDPSKRMTFKTIAEKLKTLSQSKIAPNKNLSSKDKKIEYLERKNHSLLKRIKELELELSKTKL